MPGEIGAGPRAFSNAYWFNAYGAYFGCLKDGPGECQLVINGYVWDEHNKIEQPSSSTTYSVPTCADYKNCAMTYIRFPHLEYSRLSGVQFQMIKSKSNNKVDYEDFVMDNLSLGWYNNTCEAGLTRISQRK